MIIHRGGSAIGRGPAGISSGPFWGETLIDTRRDGENSAVFATFEPGSITHWHAHPLGQILYALAGVGLVQRDGGSVEEVRAGDCVWFPPGERHWHGATSTSLFSYFSVQGSLAGRVADWMEPVGDSRRKTDLDR